MTTIPRRRARRSRAKVETPDATSTSSECSNSAPTKRLSVSLMLAAVGALLLYLALPPMQISMLAWLAPLPWVLVIRRQTWDIKRPYLWIWAIGCVHWLGVMYGVRLAHWALNLGWVVLAAYLAVYLPLFIGITRVAVHRYRCPVAVSAAVVWTALELARAYVATGFGGALLGHTQVSHLELIQIADLVGGYGVSFVIMFVVAAVAGVIPWLGQRGRRQDWVALGAAGMLLLATLGYGWQRLKQAETRAPETLKVALLQEPIDSFLEYNQTRLAEIHRTYFARAAKACRQHPDLDVVIWPESVFLGFMSELQQDGPILNETGDPTITAEMLQANFDTYRADYESTVEFHAEQLNGPVPGEPTLQPQIYQIVGAESQVYGDHSPYRYNSALLVDPTGSLQARYYKNHLVMFGEYIPFGQQLPWLYTLTPMSGGLNQGKSGSLFSIKGWHLSPSICFETFMPQVSRRHMRQLTDVPDVLVNLTNDGWFHGSSILDLHFNSAVFRAVECRRPLVVAANTGISGHVDSTGKVMQRTKRKTGDTVIAEVTRSPLDSSYVRFGDLPWFCCLFLTLLVGGRELWDWWRKPRQSAE